MTYISKKNNTNASSELSSPSTVNKEIADAQERLQTAQSLLKERLRTVTDALEEQKTSFARFRSEIENLKGKLETLDQSARSCRVVTEQWRINNLDRYSRKLKSVA